MSDNTSDRKPPRQKSRTLASAPRARRRDTSEDVAHAIGCRMVKGIYPPGGLLPTEHELCALLGVSRPALREGFRLLGARGMIVGRRRIGTLVRPRADWNMLDATVLAWHLEQEPSESYIDGLFEARMAVEPPAAALAARRGGADAIAEIAAAFQRMSEAQAGVRLRKHAAVGPGRRSPQKALPKIVRDADEITDTVTADLRFHVAILAAAGNPFLSSFGALIGSSLTAAFRLNWRAHASEPQLSLAQHEDVLRAIGDGDAARAEAGMRALLETAGQDARQALLGFTPGGAVTQRKARAGQQKQPARRSSPGEHRGRGTSCRSP